MIFQSIVGALALAPVLGAAAPSPVQTGGPTPGDCLVSMYDDGYFNITDGSTTYPEYKYHYNTTLENPSVDYCKWWTNPAIDQQSYSCGDGKIYVEAGRGEEEMVKVANKIAASLKAWGDVLNCDY